MGAPKDPEKRKQWIENISKSQKGKKRKPLSKETKKKIGLVHKGRKLTKEHKQKLSNSKKEFYNTEEGRKIASQNAKKFWERLTEEEKIEFLQPWIKAGQKASNENPKSEEWSRKQSEARKKYFASMSQEEKLELLSPWIEAGLNASSSSSISKKEVKLGEYIQSKGFEIETQKKIGPYYVDIFIPSKNLIIEFNGCFWHQCEKCGYDDENANIIREKDKKRIEFLRSQGYDVGIVWEHEFQTR